MDGRKLANDVLNGLPRAKVEKPRPEGTGRTRFGDSYSPGFFAVVEKLPGECEPALMGTLQPSPLMIPPS